MDRRRARSDTTTTIIPTEAVGYSVDYPDASRYRHTPPSTVSILFDLILLLRTFSMTSYLLQPFDGELFGGLEPLLVSPLVLQLRLLPQELIRFVLMFGNVE
ncbi:hypothetical protein NDA13_004433 [Ustilago tritici]|nr:hypothetical protein NDA13_004433 [Ustilago tritici]